MQATHMPRLMWVEVASGMTEHATRAFLDAIKSYTVKRSQLVTCNICENPGYHKARYQLIWCDSTTCENCSWRGKIMTCQDTMTTDFYSMNEHTASIQSPPRKTLNEQEKAYCREMAGIGIRPARIKSGLKKKFKPSVSDGPELRSVQNYVNYYLRSEMDNTDKYEVVAAAVRGMAFTGHEDDCTAFTFCRDYDEFSLPVVGDGSDSMPLLVGMTTKAMLRRMDRPPESFVFHLDTTFKTNTLSYPILVVGISDRCRTFHLVAMFVISQRLETVLAAALSALRMAYTAVTGKQMVVRYVMGDAEIGQLNAVERVFQDCDMQFLMCYFHVLKNVRERKPLDEELLPVLMRYIYDMHFTSSVSEFETKRDEALRAWRTRLDLQPFADYFERTWLISRVSSWQCFLTPPGYATTNNPVETFNNRLKRDYTFHRRHKMGMLLQHLKKCCEDDSTSLRMFIVHPEATEALHRRATQMAAHGTLAVNPNALVGYSHEVQQQLSVIRSSPGPDFEILGTKRTEEYLAVTAQMGSNYARMEHQDQPLPGWPVHVGRQWCPCRYWMKFGVCIHVLMALQFRRVVDCHGNRLLVDRTAGKKRGRPPKNGPALSRV
jgi:hypothetical protein